MDHFFDHVARRLAATTTRRDAVKVILAAAAGLGASECPGLTTPGGSCASGECKGNDGQCYSCSGGTTCTTSGGSNCSSPRGGVYCCGGGNGGSCQCQPGNTWNYLTGICCPNTAPYYDPGNHGYKAGCYAQCPYIGDCGSAWTRC